MYKFLLLPAPVFMSCFSFGREHTLPHDIANLYFQ